MYLRRIRMIAQIDNDTVLNMRDEKKNQFIIKKLYQYDSNVRKIKYSLLSLFCLGGSITAFVGGCLSQNNDNQIPVIPTVLKYIGLAGFVGTTALNQKYKTKPTAFIHHLNKIKWNKNGGQTVSKDIFDALTFYREDSKNNTSSPYNTFTRIEFEKTIKQLDLSELKPNKQQELLQMILDTCDKHPAMARLFRQTIFPTRIHLKKPDNVNDAANYIPFDDTPIIEGEFKNLSKSKTFMHEYLHATQDRAGLQLYNHLVFIPMSRLISEAEATATSFLCQTDENDPMYMRFFYDCALKETQNKYRARKLKTPANLSADNIKRYISGVAEEKAIGRMMEILLSPPEQFKTLFKKIPNAPEPSSEACDYFQSVITLFQNAYHANEAAQLMQSHPDITTMLLNAYSQKLHYAIQPILSGANGNIGKQTAQQRTCFVNKTTREQRQQ